MPNRLLSDPEKKSFLSGILSYSIAALLISVPVLLCANPVHSYPTQEQQDSEESPIALVNGMPILPSDLSCAVEAWKFSTRHGTAAGNAGTLNQLIVIELLYQESLKHRFHGLVADAEEVYRREIKRAGSEEKLRSTLQCNNISLKQFRQYIFRNLAINRLLDKKVYSRITVSDEEIDEYYEANRQKYKTPESVRLRQIFIRAPNRADEKNLFETENLVRNVFEQAVKGNDFVMLARKYSDDPIGASAGGEMGVIFRGNLHPTFESLVFSRGDGSVTEPVKSHSGYHIFQVVATFPSAPKPLEEVRPRIVNEIRKSKARTMISDYVSNLRQKAEIRIFGEEQGE
jgi:parvulin-like peptidyl-prolyl isomerase